MLLFYGALVTPSASLLPSVDNPSFEDYMNNLEEEDLIGATVLTSECGDFRSHYIALMNTVQDVANSFCLDDLYKDSSKDCKRKSFLERNIPSLQLDILKVGWFIIIS